MDDQNDFDFEILKADDFTPYNTITDSVEDFRNNKKEAVMTDKKAFEVKMVEDSSILKNFITSSCEVLDVTIEDVRINKEEAVMTDKKVSDVEMVEDDSALNNSITSSCEVIDVTIENIRNNKKILASTMDSVISLMREVESKEKAAKQAKAEAVISGLDVLSKAEELKQAQRCVKETNDKHAKEVYGQQVVLATDMKLLQFRVSEVLNDGGTSVEVLDEIRNVLEKRLTTALREKELADKEKLDKELSAQKVLAYEESQMKKVVEESERLKQEAIKNSKLQEFLKDRGHVVDILDEDIYDKCRDVNLLKESLDNAVSLSEVLSSSQMLSIIGSSSSSLTTENPKEINEQPGSHAVLEKSFGFDLNASTDDNVQSALEKEIKTSSIIASSGSSLTNEIPNERNELADSHVVLPKPFVFGLDASTNDHAQPSSQKQIKSGNSAAGVFSQENVLFSKISDSYLEKQEGNKNVVFGAGVKNAGYSKSGQATSTEGWVALAAQKFSEGLTFQSTIKGSTCKEGLRGSRKKSHIRNTDSR